MFRETYDWQTFNNDNEQLLSDNNEKRQYENLFVQLESNINDRVFISTGLNGNLTRFKYTDHFTENGDQSGNRDYKPVLSPRLGINLLLNKQCFCFWKYQSWFFNAHIRGDFNARRRHQPRYQTGIGMEL